MDKIRKEFPVLRKGVYLNTAVYGPLYDSLIDWRQEHDLDFLLHGSEMRENTLKVIADTRANVGDFFNCKKNNVALVNNFSIGLNTLLEGIDVRKKVLLFNNDYPSVNWAFENRNFDISYVKMGVEVEADIEAAIKKGHIDILAFSLVQWLDGFLIDLDFIKRLKQSHPDLLIIADGTQFCGAKTFDFDNSGIDVLGASAYKWLLSGYGNGFMMFSDRIIEECSVNTIGFNAANGNFDNRDNIRFAKKFEPGHLSSLNFGSLNFSLQYFQNIGMDKITEHNKFLSQRAKEEFAGLGLLDQHIVEREKHSGIFNIKVDESVFQSLFQKNIVCAQRGSGVRLGFHFYNNESDLDTVVKILKTAK
ncbi:aminotransferase class V-fold PLP-dependent enzyme [Maribacter sp. MMG018]|uniref:aminotransferase class V-fold PLP-dependent enzyme n=1 Tax=Maribacter sp. MMG018 TaxID=2822688 RepID=UPI001B387333|nr:aminotransferase class V-fold PLP-dependent enzyme [Maribacter sp. MMG018]MBQ4916008.1 aminotransferase class V-fold PLP-dependent enzyme [Maribacter sp. MMG018]